MTLLREIRDMIYRYFVTIGIRMIGKSEGLASGIEDLGNYSPSADCLALLRTSKNVRRELQHSLRRPIYTLMINESWIYSTKPDPAHFVFYKVLPLFVGRLGSLCVKFLPDRLKDIKSEIVFRSRVARAKSVTDYIFRTRFDRREKGIYLIALQAFAKVVTEMQRCKKSEDSPRLEVVFGKRLDLDGRDFLREAVQGYPNLENILSSKINLLWLSPFHPRNLEGIFLKIGYTSLVYIEGMRVYFYGHRRSCLYSAGIFSKDE